MDELNNTLIDLSCYEPAGASIPISESDLLGHTLVIGGSGAGKTTRIMNPMLKQLIEHNASRQEEKIGLCIIDSKGDGETSTLLNKLCREAGRLEDLITVDDSGANSIDLLEPMRTRGLEGVNEVASVLTKLIAECESNRYWEMTMGSMIKQVLRLIHLSDETLSYSSLVSLLTDYLLQFRFNPQLIELIDELKQSEDHDYDEVTNIAINETISVHRMWTTLDVRTRSNLQSMTAPIVDALGSPDASKLLSGSASIKIQDITASGSILLVSVDAVRSPELAALVSVVVKSRFYEAILSRGYSDQRQHRMAGLVLDDWPLCATGSLTARDSDVSALSIMRSRKGFMVAATQSIAAIDIKIGWRSRRAAMANFTNLFLMRSRDMDTDVFAASYLGESKRILIDRSIQENPNSARKPATARFERESIVPSVPVGALARLPVGESYALIGDAVYNTPHCLVPVFTPEPEILQSHE